MTTKNPQPDYADMAQSMLKMWQNQWQQFGAMMAPAAAEKSAPQPETKSSPASPPPHASPADANWVDEWGKFMAGWAATDGKAPPQPAPPVAPKQEAKREEKREEQRDVRPAPSFVQPAAKPAAPAMAKAATTAPGERDVLFAELARRVEFLHERMVKLEAELERLRRRL